MKTSLIRLFLVACIITHTTACSLLGSNKEDFSPAEPEIILAERNENGAIYQPSSNLFLFEDIRARRVGDVINVILDESTNASKTASTNANKATAIGLPSPTILGGELTVGGRSIFQNDIQGSADFAGAADSTQSNRLSGSIAVVVERVLPNGNLMIRGQKRLTLNQGSETVRVAGLVRSVDITPNNTIRSNQIADAKISYGGTGMLADANRAGWLTRLFSSAFWPF